MKFVKHFVIFTLVLLMVCLVCAFSVSAEEATTVRFSELKGIEENVLSSETFSAAISSRAGVETGTSDLRIVVVANRALLNANADATVTVSLGGKTFTKSVVEELEVFLSAKAADKTYVAAEDSVLTGFVITGVPNDQWDEVTVTLSTAEVNYTGSCTNAEVITYSAAIKIGTNYVLKIENHHASTNYQPTSYFWAYKESDNEERQAGRAAITAIKADPSAYIVKIKYNDALYTSKVVDANTGGNLLIRCSLEDMDLIGLNKDAKIPLQYFIYNTDGDLVYYTGVINHTVALQNVFVTTLPTEGLEKVAPDTSDITLEGHAKEYDARTGLFDGNTASSKLCCSLNDDKTVTVGFKLTQAATLSYYTLYTGNDTSKYPSRNPDAWSLYGKVGDEWILLSHVYAPDMTSDNATPFSYAIENPQECTEYKIVFRMISTDTTFQLNELEFFKTVQ